MTSPSSYAMFSSHVRLRLETSSGVVPLASISPTELIPRIPAEIASGEAEVVMEVDGEWFRWSVELPNGAVPFNRSIRSRQIGTMRRGPIDPTASATPPIG